MTQEWKDIQCSLFPNASSVDPETVTIGFCLRGIRGGRWAEELQTVRQALEEQGKEAYGKAKATLPAFCVQASMATRRKGADRRVQLNGLIQIDVDHIDNAEEVRDRVIGLPYIGAAWVSPSGKGVKAIARATENLKGSHRRLTELLGAEGLEVDQTTKDNVRLCFVGHDPGLKVKALSEVELVEGIPEAEPEPEVPSLPGTTDDLEADRIIFRQIVEGDEGAGEGERNATAYRLALAGRDRGLSLSSSFQGLKDWNGKLDSPITHRELVDTVKNAYRYAKGQAGAMSVAALPDDLEGEEDLTSKEIDGIVSSVMETNEYDISKRRQAVEECGVATDLDASAAFVAEHKDVLRYNSALNWLSWNGERWNTGGNAKLDARELSKRAARKRMIDAMNMEDGSDEAKQAFAKAVILESAGKITAVLDLAASDPRMLIHESQLDADPWKLCVANGTLDTRTMELLPHDPADLITRQAPVVWRGLDYRNALFDKYLDSLPPDMREFLPRAFGSSLVADSTADALFLLQGPGGAGKTTLAKAFHKMLGTYAVKLRVEAVCATKSSSQDSASPSLMALRGSRFAFVSESNRSAKLDSGRLKEWSGGEPISARGLHQDPIEFETTWKLWIVSNFDPQCDADDSGFWRRLVKIGFPVIKNPDPTLRDRLAEDPDAQSALLSWAARGCQEWIAAGRGRRGYGVPETVDAMTSGYRESQDHMSAWLCDMQSNGWALDQSLFTASNTLRSAYEAWAKDQGEFPWGNKRYSAWLKEQGMVAGRDRVNGLQVRGWTGIGIKSGTEGLEI